MGLERRTVASRRDDEVRYEVYDPEVDEAPAGDPKADCTGEGENDGTS
jgi:hypothetical protein